MKNVLAAALLALGLGVASHVQAAPSLQFDAVGPYDVTDGDTLVVSLKVVDLGAEIVAAFDLDVMYDPGVLSLSNVDFDILPMMHDAGDPFDDPIYDAVLSTGGLQAIMLSFLSDADLQSLQGGMSSITLFTMTFDVIATADDTAITLGPLSAALGKDVKGLGNRVIIPGEVPEPATLWLLALALFGTALARLRRRTTR